jgi:UDP-N-acetylmuramoyl-tripeptide--D-alanyl-D-alanine ligase
MAISARFPLVLAFFFCYGITSLYDYHMLQLNSYKTRVQLNWLRHNFGRGYLLRHFFSLPLVAVAFFGPMPAGFLSVSFYGAQLYLNRPRKAKKPLVYTNRVKRMLTTHAILIAGLVACSFSMSHTKQALLLAFFLSLTPFATLLSNLLNAPLERRINKRYIEDAKRILRKTPRPIVIGVTGSYGKTSTKYFLQKLLSFKFNTLMTPESFNSTLGVVKTLRTQLKPIHEVFICEMGAKGAGEIKEICDIVEPRYGVITSIGPQHLESFKTLENVIETKFELADALPEEGALFLICDNDHIRNKLRDGSL